MSLLAVIFGNSHSVDDDNGWFTRNFGGVTHADVRVDEFNSLEVTVVYSAIGILSDSMAVLPADIIEVKDDGTRKDDSKHSLHRVLNLRANPFMSAFTFKNTLTAHLTGWGNGYAEIQRDQKGDVIALWPLLPDRTRPVRKNGSVRYETVIDGQMISLPAENVLHIPAMGFDGLIGYSQLYLARQAIGLAKGAEEYGSKFFANEARSGGFVQYPGTLGPVGQKNLADSVNEQGGLKNAQRIKVLEEGAKFVATTIPPEEAQFLQTRTFQIEEIARMYRVPLFMLQSQSKSTAWGTGLGEMTVGFVKFTLQPWIMRWEQELTFKCLMPSEIDKGVAVKFNVNAFLRGDSKSRSEFYAKALNPQAGWMEQNEVRALEDLNPLEEDEEEEEETVEVVEGPPVLPAPEEDDEPQEATE